MTLPRSALVALDWGTSSLRAYRLDASGAVLDTRANGCGIQYLPAPGIDGFEAAFTNICGDWLAADPVPVVAAGMVGSAQGWREVPYLTCPAGPDGLAAAAVQITSRAGHKVTLAPGLMRVAPGVAPDVMRGEEVQIAGVLATYPELARDAMLVLPGTHSKWASMAAGKVVDFATYMTGEVFAVLRQHSILGRLMPDEVSAPAPDWSAFERGLDQARNSALTHDLFSVRTLGLTEDLPKAALPDYLSGLLIGHEVLAAGGACDAQRPLFLVGEGGLCRRYAHALEILLGRTPTAAPGNPAPAGLFLLAVAAGLVTPETETCDD